MLASHFHFLEKMSETKSELVHLLEELASIFVKETLFGKRLFSSRNKNRTLSSEKREDGGGGVGKAFRFDKTDLVRIPT